MRKSIAAAVGVLLLGCCLVDAQPLTYDLYYVLPGEARMCGADLGFSTPAIDEAADLSDLDVLAKYAVTDGFEVGGRATLGFFNKDADDLSAVTIGAKYSVAELTALTVNLSAKNESDELGMSVGVMSSMLVGDIGVNSHALFAFLDGYTSHGALMDVLIQPVMPLSERAYAYLDVMLSTDTEKPNDRASLILGPNLDYEVMPGLMVNGGIQFSLYSGELITHDTDLGLVLSVFKTAPLW